MESKYVEKQRLRNCHCSLLIQLIHRNRSYLAAGAVIASGATGNSTTKRLPTGLFSSTRMEPR